MMEKPEVLKALAEAIGWKRVYLRPDGLVAKMNSNGTDTEFNPHENAKVVEEIKEWIQDQGWWIEIEWQAKTNEVEAPGIWVHVWNPVTEEHIRKECYDDEKRAIVDAAIEIAGIVDTDQPVIGAKGN